VRRGLLHPGPGEGADRQLVVALLGLGVLAEQGADDAAEEPEGDRDQARVAQREEAKSMPGARDVGVPDPTGEKMTRTTAAASPP
jgi:hypothetical protein